MTTADNQPLGQALAENQAFLQTMFGGSSDFYTKSFTICGCRCCIAMFAGLSSPEKLCIMVLHALGQGVPGCKAGPQLVQYLAEQSCLPTEQTPITTRTQLVETLAGGMAVLVECVTDNRNRTAGSMRHHFDKFGGNLGATGCVSWSFDKKGVLVIDNEDGDYEEDQVMMDAMDCGADDFEAEDDVFTVYTDPDDFNAVADAMTQKGYSFVSAQIEMVPQNYQKLTDPEQISLMEKLLDIMDDDDDVQNVWHNWDED